MKFYRFQYITNWEYFFIVPTISLTKNDLIYMNKNFRVAFHWLGWHMSWLWMHREETK